MRIQHLLNFRGLRQKEVACALGITQQSLSSICSGKRGPPVRIITPLAELLGVSEKEVLAAFAKLKESQE